MKDPIHTNNIYVGVAWFCHRSFLFSSPPPLSPLPPPLPQHPVAGIQHRGIPAPLGTNTQSKGEGTSHVPTQPKLRQGLTWATQLWGSCLPTLGRALSHIHKWNFLRSFISEGEATSWYRAHSGNATEAPGSGMRPPILHPSSPTSAGCERGLGDTTAFPGAWTVFSFLFNPNSLPSSLGMGGAC